MQRLTAVAVRSTMAGPVVEQLAACALLDGADAALEEHRQQLRERRAVLVAELRSRLPAWRVPEPAGGLVLWCGLPSARSRALVAAAEAHGLRLAAGPLFGTGHALDDRLRLPYTHPPDVLRTPVGAARAGRRGRRARSSRPTAGRRAPARSRRLSQPAGVGARRGGGGGPQHLLDRQAELAGQRGDVLVLDAHVDHPPAGDGDLHADAAAEHLDRRRRPLQRHLAHRHDPQADGRRRREDRRLHGRHRVGPAQHRERVRRAALLHQDRRQPGVGGAGGEQRVQDAGPQPRVEVVDVGLQDDGPGRRRLGRRRPAPAGRRSAARPGRGRRRPCRRARRASAAASSTRPRGRATSAAPVGVHISAGTAPATHRDPGQQFQHGRAGDRDDAVRARGPSRCPARRGRRSAGSGPRCSKPATTPDDVGQRVERADLVEVHVLGRHPVHAALGDRQPLEHRQRAVAHGRRQGGLGEQARGRRPRCGACEDSGACTCTRVAPSPCRVTCSVTSRICSTGSAATAAAGTSSGTPASTSAPSSMSPDAPGGEVQPADHAVIIPGRPPS